MTRVSAIILLTVTLLVGRVRLSPRDDGSADSTTVEATTKGKNSTEPVTESATEPTTRPTPVDHRKNEKLEKPVEPSSNSTANRVAKTAGLKEWTNCTYDEEQKDMQNCFVIEQGRIDDDDEDDDVVQASTESRAEPTTQTIVANKEGANVTKTSVPADEPKTTRNQGTTWLNRTAYVTVSADPDPSKNTSVTESSSVEAKPGSRTEAPVVSSVAPLLVESVRSIESERIGQTAKSTDRNDNNGMPGGVIALVTAVTFAILIVIGYVGMVAWRRYLEYRYGHRELLVNDLEFDGNDLRHFEL